MSVHRFKSAQRFSKRVGTNHQKGVNAAGNPYESWRAIHKDVVADLELEIDVEAVMRLLGHRAVNSRGRKAVLQGGIVKVKVTGERDAG